MLPLSGAIKCQKKSEIICNVVKLQKISTFLPIAIDENNTYNKVC